MAFAGRVYPRNELQQATASSHVQSVGLLQSLVHSQKSSHGHVTRSGENPSISDVTYEDASNIWSGPVIPVAGISCVASIGMFQFM